MCRCKSLVPVVLLAFGSALVTTTSVYGAKQDAGEDDGEAAFTHRSADPFLTVGDHRFSRDDIELRKEQIRWKYPGYPEDRAARAACTQLILGYLLVEVLEAIGHPVTGNVLWKELHRIDRNTKRPKQLEALKAIYADQTDKYAAIGILPDLANRRYFYEVFPELEEVQASVRARATKILRLLEKGDAVDLEVIAARHDDLEYRRFLFHRDRGFLRMLPESGRPDGDAPARDRFREWSRTEAEGERARLFERLEEEVFAGLARGRVFPRVVEFDRDFSLLQSLGWHDRQQRVRMVGRLVLPKITPHDHFREQAATIPVWIEDDELRRDLIRNRPDFAYLQWQEPDG